MPNEFQSISSGAAELKNAYPDDESGLKAALKKKLESLANTKRQAPPPGADDEQEK